MSPYRVLAKYLSRDNIDKFVLSSMLSVDKMSGRRFIYILLKHDRNNPTGAYYLLNQFPSIPESVKNGQAKILAHRQSGKQNSDILAKYEIHRMTDHSYMIDYIDSKSSIHVPLTYKEFTQQDCLKAAMHHYCSKNNIDIINTL